jgi:hypothetical protein
MNTQDILVKAIDVLTGVIENFWKNPFDYFYEEDIRAYLYSAIKVKIPDKGSYKCSEQFSSLKNFWQNEMFNSSIVKAEYPYSNNSRKRFDVVILENKANDFYKIPADIGIEIKMGSEETKVDNVSGYIENIQSLLEYQKNVNSFIGMALYFYQTALKDPQQYFMTDLIVEISLKDLHFEAGKIYALIITGDKKIYKLSRIELNLD